MSIVFVPVYVRFLGIEAYGLVGFYSTLLSVFSVLDFGLSATLNREMSRYSISEGAGTEARDLLRTMEVLYWSVALVIAGIIILLAPLIANHWVQPKSLSPLSVRMAVMAMGVSMFFQWPLSLYSGGLMGLQRQLLVNVINSAIAALRGFGSVFMLWRVSPTINTFFAWQIFITLIQTLLLAFALHYSLPNRGHSSPRFRRELLHKIWRFAAGMSGISLVTLSLTTLDRVLLSRLLTLEAFGYYTLAASIATCLYVISGPIYSAVFPRFSALVAKGQSQDILNLYHQSCQVVSVLILPLVAILCFFANPILHLWTGSATTANNTYLLLILLVLGNAFHDLTIVPYALSLAHGWTSLAFYQNLIATLIIVPALLWGVPRYGSLAGASLWLIVNAVSVFATMPILHHYLLPFELKTWYLKDIGIPLICVLTIVIGGRIIYSNEWSQINTILIILSVMFLSTLAAAISSSFGREMIRKYLAI